MSHAKLRELCMLALCAPMIVAGKVALEPVPNVEIVTFFIILFTVVFGWRALFPVAVFVLEEGMRYGFAPHWYIFYCVIWPLLVVLTMLVKRWIKDSALGWAIFASIIFVPIFSMTNVLLLKWLKLLGRDFQILAYLIPEIPYDIAHIVGNFAITLALFKPLYRVLERMMHTGNDPLPD